MRNWLFASAVLLTGCNGNALGGTTATEDAPVVPASNSGSVASPCFVEITSVRWQCVDDAHFRAMEIHDCHYRCGEAPCSGMSRDPTGPISTCRVGTHCFADIPVDGALPTDACR